jgi:pimeloyl-ACP methyl ester carboxylesterase
VEDAVSIKDMLYSLFIRGKSKILPQDAQKKLAPILVARRNADANHAAVIFVHGFHGDATATWASFIAQLLGDYRLNDWDIYSVGYPTNLSIDLPIWTSDPDIKLCATGLVTKLRHAPLDRYKAITIVAHSMGGLVVQRALLNSEDLRTRVAHVVLFGTPSAGVSKAALGARLKPQARDMCEGSRFVVELRKEWQKMIGENPPFSFTAVAGETDAFIPASSSIDPFPISQQAAVPGNHLETVRPDSIDHLSYDLLYGLLTDSRRGVSATESGRLAVERKEFGRAIELLMPGANGLDANAIVSLALALESVGRDKDAFDVIDNWNRHNEVSCLDPIGVLAGRLKRRWLVSRQQKDFDRALQLYTDGLKRAEAMANHEQAYYHAINVAFLLLMSEVGDGPASPVVADMAKRAIEHVESSHESQWTHATRGEAYLMLGNLPEGVAGYQEARRRAKTIRECDSMHMQAVIVASRTFSEDGARSIDEVFEL